MWRPFFVSATAGSGAAAFQPQVLDLSRPEGARVSRIR